MQLCTKNVVMTRVISDPTNFKIFPIVCRLFLMNLNIPNYINLLLGGTPSILPSLNREG